MACLLYCGGAWLLSVLPHESTGWRDPYLRHVLHRHLLWIRLRPGFGLGVREKGSDYRLLGALIPILLIVLIIMESKMEGGDTVIKTLIGICCALMGVYILFY